MEAAKAWSELSLANNLFIKYRDLDDKTLEEADDAFWAIIDWINNSKHLIDAGKRLSELEKELSNVIDFQRIQEMIDTTCCDEEVAQQVLENEQKANIIIEKRLNQQRAIDLFNKAIFLKENIWNYYIWKVYLDQGNDFEAVFSFDKYLKWENSIDAYKNVVYLIKDKWLLELANKYITEAISKFWEVNPVSSVLLKYQRDINRLLKIKPVKILKP